MTKILVIPFSLLKIAHQHRSRCFCDLTVGETGESAQSWLMWYDDIPAHLPMPEIELGVHCWDAKALTCQPGCYYRYAVCFISYGISVFVKPCQLNIDSDWGFYGAHAVRSIKGVSSSWVICWLVPQRSCNLNLAQKWVWIHYIVSRFSYSEENGDLFTPVCFY